MSEVDVLSANPGDRHQGAPRRSHRSQPPSSKRSRTRRILAVLIVVAVLLVALVAGLLLWLQMSIVGRTERVADVFPDEASRPQEQPQDTSVNFLVLGSDSRISAGDPNQWEAGAQRTDTMMLVQFSPQHNTLTAMSIPRDSWVDIPGHGEAKINAAFSYGGPKLTIQTVEQLTGVRIDHFALVDFTTFTQLTDQLGGVDIKTTEGDQHLDGAAALKFVRERYSLAGGDFDRVKRQQAWLRAVIAKTLSADTLSDPAGAYQIAATVAEGTAMDEGMTLTTMLDYARQARHLRSQNLTFITAPYTGTGTSSDGQSIVLLDQDRLAPLMKAWSEDKLADYLSDHGSDVPGLPQVVN